MSTTDAAVIPLLLVACAYISHGSRCRGSFSPSGFVLPGLQVRYPLQLSLVYGARAITQKEEAPFVVIVRNVSLLPSSAYKVTLGTQSTLGPVVEWRRIPDETSSDRVDDPTTRPVSLACPSPSASRTLETPVTWSIPEGALPPGGHVAFRGTVRFAKSSTPLYSRLPLDVQLRVVSTARVVQVR
jgi:hypothetical protein